MFLGKVKSVDASAAEKMRGVKGIVKDESFVAVVADNWWRANQALKQVKIDWDTGNNAHIDDQAIALMLREGLDAKGLPQARKMGDTAAANRALDYLFNVQQKQDGSFPQNSWANGRAICVSAGRTGEPCTSPR